MVTYFSQKEASFLGEYKSKLRYATLTWEKYVLRFFGLFTCQWLIKPIIFRTLKVWTIQNWRAHAIYNLNCLNNTFLRGLFALKINKSKSYTIFMTRGDWKVASTPLKQRTNNIKRTFIQKSIKVNKLALLENYSL